MRLICFFVLFFLNFFLWPCGGKKVREAKLDDTRNVNVFGIDPTWTGESSNRLKKKI